jgi:hypothetical protein
MTNLNLISNRDRRVGFEDGVKEGRELDWVVGDILIVGV